MSAVNSEMSEQHGQNTRDETENICLDCADSAFEHGVVERASSVSIQPPDSNNNEAKDAVLGAQPLTEEEMIHTAVTVTEDTEKITSSCSDSPLKTEETNTDLTVDNLSSQGRIPQTVITEELPDSAKGEDSDADMNKMSDVKCMLPCCNNMVEQGRVARRTGMPQIFFMCNERLQNHILDAYGLKGTEGLLCGGCGMRVYQKIYAKKLSRLWNKNLNDLEEDIPSHSVHAKSDKSGRKMRVKFSCEKCEFSCRTRHQMHLHNDRHHEMNTSNRDGITDYDTDASGTRDTSQRAKKRRYKNHRKYASFSKYVKPVKIDCVDIFKAGIAYMEKVLRRAGVTHCYVDRLTQEEMIDFAVTGQELDVTFLDTNRTNSVPKLLNSNSEIASFYYTK